MRPLPSPVIPLQPVYREAMALLAAGHDDDTIADRMGVAAITLRGWWRNIASTLPDAPPCPVSLSHRRRVHCYAVALWAQDRAA